MRAERIEEKFEDFHARHPEVYEQLVGLCGRWSRTRQRPWSIKGAFEVLRWERHLAGLPDEHEDYKLNNNYHSRYARLIMDEHPEFRGLFELRELKT
jgi:hypothetical protein